jgi:hypothetical protein
MLAGASRSSQEFKAMVVEQKTQVKLVSNAKNNSSQSQRRWALFLSVEKSGASTCGPIPSLIIVHFTLYSIITDLGYNTTLKFLLCLSAPCVCPRRRLTQNKIKYASHAHR